MLLATLSCMILTFNKHLANEKLWYFKLKYRVGDALHNLSSDSSKFSLILDDCKLLTLDNLSVVLFLRNSQLISLFILLQKQQVLLVVK